MPSVHGSLIERITIDPDVRFGKPCIRGHRITVQELLELLSGGASQEQILASRRAWFRYYATCSLDRKALFGNGLARIGDRRILEYAAEQDFVLVSTDSDCGSVEGFSAG